MDNGMMPRASDHDLLIELNIRFSSFEASNDRTWRDVNDKMSRLLLQMESKADKQDLRNLEGSIQKIEGRVQAIETSRALDNNRKETVINLGNLGIKTWTLIAGFVLFVISIVNLLRGR